MNLYRNLRFFQIPRLVLQVLIAAVTLAIGISYTLANIYLVPYQGFEINYTWRVVEATSDCIHLDTDTTAQTTSELQCKTLSSQLKVGDEIEVIEIPTRAKLYFRDQHSNSLLLSPFGGLGKDEIIFLTIIRDGIKTSVSGTLFAITMREQMSRLGMSMLFLPFWLAGTVVLLFFRPRNERWFLLITFNYLTSIWFAIGLISGSNILASGYLVAPISFLLSAVYLHFHLVLPYPLIEKMKSKWLIALHVGSALLALASLANILPANTYLVAMLVGMGGSILLLIARFVRPNTNANRSATNLMLSGLMVAILPSLLWVLPIIGGSFEAVSSSAKLLAVLALPILPFFYTYSLYKHRLGDTEVRANRALMLYSFAVVYATTFVLLFVLFYREQRFDAAALGAALAASALCQLLAFLAWGPVTRLVNRIAYGTSYEPEQLIRHFANSITRSLNRKQLLSLLDSEILPTLLVRQSALLWLAEGQQTLVHATGQERDLSGVNKDQVEHLLKLNKTKRYLTPENMPEEPFDWARLIVPIEVDDQTIGVWVFGRRDPDDFYPQADIDLATTLGNQIAVALETIRLFEAAQQRAREMERLNLELRRADRLKSDLLRNVTHELRTPLTTIHGFTELMIDDETLSAEHNEYLTAIIHSTQSLVQMVNNVLHMQQQRLATMHEGQRIDLRQLAEQSIERAQILADRDAIWRLHPHKIQLLAPKTTFWVWGEPVQLTYVLDNLLSNAIKFSPDGGLVKVNIWTDQYTFPIVDDDSITPNERIKRQSTPQSAIFVSVEDQGIGVAPEEVDNIWLEFYQGDLTETRQFGGTGIGLALVKEIVEEFGGNVWLESTSDTGSTFMVALPAYQEFAPEIVSTTPAKVQIAAQSPAIGQ